jgi:hypothetical protein
MISLDFRLIKVFLDEIQLVVNDLGDPFAICTMSARAQAPQARVLTSVKYKAVHANLFVSSDANSLYQFLLVAYRSECGHEPTVSVVALTHIVCSRTSNVELWLYEDVLASLSAMHELMKSLKCLPLLF